MRFAVPLEIDPDAIKTWQQDSPIIQLNGETMGTTWQVSLAAPAGLAETPIQAVIEDRLETVLAQMSHWRDTSLLSQFNTSPAGTSVTLPPEFAIVLETGIKVAERSSGAFDPTIGRVVNLWGYGPTPVSRAPLATEIALALETSGYHRLNYDAASKCLTQIGGLHLDFSGIAKGFAVDAVSHALQQHGCYHALIEIGGELCGLGLRPDGDPWWVEMETPTEEIPPLRVALHQLSIATSGDYIRGYHTIDPRTGEPVRHAASVSVIHRSAMLADAWATALSVLPPHEAQTLAERGNFAVRMLNRSNNTITEWISPALQAMMDE